MESPESQPTVYQAIINLSISQDNNVISQSNSFLIEKMQKFPIEFIRDIIVLLLDETLPQQYSYYLLVHLSNAISNRIRPFFFLMKNWEKIIMGVAQIISPEEQINLMDIINRFHNRLTDFLNDENLSIRSNAASCISRLIYFEFGLHLWDDFFPNLFITLNNPSNKNEIIEGTLQILTSLIENGFIQKEMPNYDLIAASIYNVFKIYLNNPSTPLNIRIKCLQMNCKSFYILDSFLLNPDEINPYSKCLIINFSQIQDQTVHHLIYDLLSDMFIRYTNSMNLLMPNIYPYIFQDLTSNDTFRKIHAIEFWSKIAINEKQMRLNVLIPHCCSQLVPIFLSLLVSEVDIDRKKSIEANKDVDADEEIEFEENDFFSVIDNSMFCLRSFVEADPKDVAPQIINFIQQNFNSQNVAFKIASLNAIYCVLKFPEFAQILFKLMPDLISMAEQDENVELQSCAMFIIAKALLTHKSLIANASCFDKIMSIVYKRILAVISIANNDATINFNSNANERKIKQISDNKKNLILNRTFYLFMKVIKCFEKVEMRAFLAQSFDRIWSIFDMFFAKYPSYRLEPSSIIIVFETIGNFISNLPIQSKDNIIKILTFAFMNIKKEIQAPQVNWSVFVSMNCHVINNVVLKIKNDIEPFVEEIMNVFSILLSREDEEIFCEVLRVIQSFIYFFKAKFHFYYEKLSEILVKILACYQQMSTQNLVDQAIRVIGEMFSNPNQYLIKNASNYYNLISKVFSSILERTPLSITNQQQKRVVKCRFPFTKDILPDIIRTISLVMAASTTDRDGMFVDQIANLKMAQDIQIDVAVDEDKELAYNLYESILFCYKILVQIVDDENKNKIMINMKQIIEAFDNLYNYSVISSECFDLFLFIVYNIVKKFRYSFCKNLNSEKYSVILKIIELIKNSPDEDLNQKVMQLTKEIDKCNWLKDAYNY